MGKFLGFKIKPLPGGLITREPVWDDGPTYAERLETQSKLRQRETKGQRKRRRKGK